ncbi:MAG: RHS repeat-associated core domain-containing protein [Gammaproteobacteria bacterium]|nr:RHS repeat-associated core domain-containing protein [Gammaproteobacteria bacterium]
MAITNPSGKVIERTHYSAWGEPLKLSASLTVSWANRVTSQTGFTQHQMLEELQLVHMNARVYDPRTGRMLAADTILGGSAFDGQSYSRYAYVGNNPLGYWDPTGREPDSAQEKFYEEMKQVREDNDDSNDSSPSDNANKSGLVQLVVLTHNDKERKKYYFYDEQLYYEESYFENRVVDERSYPLMGEKSYSDFVDLSRLNKVKEDILWPNARKNPVEWHSIGMVYDGDGSAVSTTGVISVEVRSVSGIGLHLDQERYEVSISHYDKNGDYMPGTTPISTLNAASLGSSGTKFTLSSHVKQGEKVVFSFKNLPSPYDCDNCGGNVLLIRELRVVE